MIDQEKLEVAVSVNGMNMYFFPNRELFHDEFADKLAQFTPENVERIEAEWEEIREHNVKVYDEIQKRIVSIERMINNEYEAMFNKQIEPFAGSLLHKAITPYDLSTDMRRLLSPPRMYKHTVKLLNRIVPLNPSKETKYYNGGISLTEYYHIISKEYQKALAIKKNDSVETPTKVEVYIDFCEKIGALRNIIGLNYDKIIKRVNLACRTVIMTHNKNLIDLNKEFVLEGDLIQGFAFIFSSKLNGDSIVESYSCDRLITIMKNINKDELL